MDRNSLDQAAPGKVLRLHMEGIDDLSGDVRLGSFIEKLACLKAALSETEHLLAHGKRSKLDFVVSELSHNSPAMIGLRGVSEVDSAINAESVIDELTRFIDGVRSGTEIVTSEKAKLIAHLKKLASGIGERFTRIWLDGIGIKTIHLDANTAQAFEDAMPNTRRETGSLKGIVKQYSAINNRYYFKIVPPIGGIEIKCIFTQELLEKAAAAVEHNATVEGELKYYNDDFWPFEIKVKDIKIHPKDCDLPSLAEMKRSAPDATGDQSAEDYVRELRSGW
ncbi:hypothetical protein [Pseudomonas aeruginosa]|uniref:hypothetical protein n=1 Tax=Pseudomonas aeruginosa TaxID=287 RepID=UPI00201E3059|nr:hypothetical protein [Pseudomonas aeruginosa]MCM1998986.1 hypothetical protein [Pseudomonas aeruginosa]MCM2005308.1 hypothetical protein [Pseudomonas aeruginosa]MCM2011320.1 hypothetical protein [Pseudomonas aeruginosa]MCM2018657.1 hypothetical protein [Pseudomonas aeruginosa]MCM2025084.1 hypothetical protein [Pseudomonas aeruginosa]